MRHKTNQRVAFLAMLTFVSRVAALAALSHGGQLPPTAPTLAGRAALGKVAWMRVETPHFTLFGEAPEARLRAIADRLEAFRGALEWLHPGSRTSPRETFVYVFKNAEQGWPFTPAPPAGGHVLGVAPPYDVGNYVTVAAPLDDPPLDILYHTYAHQFLDDNFPRLPLTVSEGLAEFYSGFSVAPAGPVIGLGNSDHVRFMQENEALPLPLQFSLDARAPLVASADSRKAFVAGSWALMHYLVSGSGDKRTRLPDFLEALQRGTPSAAAAQHAFGTSLDQLRQEVAQYVRGNRFLPLRIRQETGSAAAPQTDAVRGRALGRDEVLAALGDLLGHTAPERAADAEEYFREALGLNPNQARAHSGLGYLKYSRNQFDEALPHLERAIAIEPDAMSCYLLARSLLKVNASAPAAGAGPGPEAGTPPWLGRARDLLARAIALRPGFAAPYVVLGATHTLHDGDASAGIALLQKARIMLPARTDIAGNLVYLLFREGDFVRAQRLVEEALVHGGDEAALKAARAAIKTFEDHLAAKQSLHKERTPEKKAFKEGFKEAFLAEQARRTREELTRTEDPEARAKLEAELKNLEQSLEAVDENEAAEIYNQAVDRANRREYDQAIALLENLLPRVRNQELKQQIEGLLERFKKDAARLRQPVQ